MQRFDILVIGASTVGAAAALGLARLGHEVALIDRKLPRMLADDDPLDARVIALSPGSRRLLEALDAWQHVRESRIAAYHDMQVMAGRGAVEFSDTEHGLAALGWIVELAEMDRALWQEIERQRRITRYVPAEIDLIETTPDEVRVSLADGQQLTGALLVGADGANSLVRRAAGITSHDFHYNQCALVTHLETEKLNPGIAWQRFTSLGPLALLPLPNARFIHHTSYCGAARPASAAFRSVAHPQRTDEYACGALGRETPQPPGLTTPRDGRVVNEAGEGHSSLVWSVHADSAERLMADDDAGFIAALNEHAEGSPFGPVERIGTRHALPLVRRQSDRLTAGRVVLAGDAARSVHPLAGQGLNLGLGDIAGLIEALAGWKPDDSDKRNDKRDPGPRLARMARRRWSDSILVGGGIHVINEARGFGELGLHAMGAGFAAMRLSRTARDLFVQRACGLREVAPAAEVLDNCNS